jgi:hypothetical protein
MVLSFPKKASTSAYQRRKGQPLSGFLLQGGLVTRYSAPRFALAASSTPEPPFLYLFLFHPSLPYLLWRSNQMCRVIYPLWGCGHAFSERELSRWGPTVHTILCERAWEQYHNVINRIGRWGFQSGYYQVDPRPCGSWERGQEVLTRTWCMLCAAERDTPTSQGISGLTSWTSMEREGDASKDERERWWYGWHRPW